VATEGTHAAPPGFFSWANLLSWAKIIFVILFIKGCVIDQYTVPTDSMVPTIQGDPGYFTGDRILVNKWKYGIRIPFTTTWLKRWDAPKRWDIAVFKPLPTQSKYPILVKRVVGLPGERIRLKDGNLYVNDELVPFPDFMPKECHYVNGDDLVELFQRAPTQQDRIMINSLAHSGPEGRGPVYGCVDEEKYTLVPPGHYFMLGDNSMESLDARFWGWLPQEQILGPVFAIWWPWSHRRDFSGFSHTWWGQGLLWGIPLGVVALELRMQWMERKRRRALAEEKPARTKAG